MNDIARNITLGTQLRRAAQELHDTAVPPQLLADIHASLDRREPARTAPQAAQRSWIARPLGWGFASAFAVLLAWLSISVLQPATELEEAQLADDFVPLVASERWRDAAASSSGAAWLVATEMPASKLASLGLPYDPSRAGETVRAQLLMHSSGDVLAVRVVR